MEVDLGQAIVGFAQIENHSERVVIGLSAVSAKPESGVICAGLLDGTVGNVTNVAGACVCIISIGGPSLAESNVHFFSGNEHYAAERSNQCNDKKSCKSLFHVFFSFMKLNYDSFYS